MIVSQQTADLLELLQRPRVGPARAREAIAAMRPGESFQDAVRRTAPAIAEEIRDAACRERDGVLATCADLGIDVLGLLDPEYPPMLKRIADAPPLLYVRGAVSALSMAALAVVGTREMSETGARNARNVAGFLVRKGFAVVSGLALGIDSQAHLGALDARGTTVAVLAHGLHTVAPTSNRALADRILVSGGALVSEHPPGVPPRPAEFVRRNRIQSGLCLGSVMVESAAEGGAIHQAAFTKAQGRSLMTLLAASDETRGDLNEAGAKHLLATKGAIALRSTGDLGRELARLRDTLVDSQPAAPSTLF